MSGCVSNEGTPSPSASEASKLLEAALEQMDGIIQGAKFDFPNYFDLQQPNHSVGSRHAHHNSHSHAPAVGGVAQALTQLQRAIAQDPSRGRDHRNSETSAFLHDWLGGSSHNGNHAGSAWDRNDNEAGVVSQLEQSLLATESENESLKFQMGVLTEQVEQQVCRVRDLERLLNAKKDLLKTTEQALEREKLARSSASETSPPSGSRLEHLSELSHVKGRCATLEKENQELRAICGGNRTPKYLPLSPQRPRKPLMGSEDSSPEDCSGRKEVGFVDQDEDIPETDLDSSTASTRPPRGFKKIFGKIKRSNSGGHLEDNKRPGTPEFRRGGHRATTGGRLGYSAERSREIKRPISEWNTDMIVTWLECLGLGMYAPEIQKHIGHGEQLAKMGLGDLESKLNIKHYLHRKKLSLALSARQDTVKPDREGNLDYQWVLRWLDDIGLPQHKDAFLEARVDGRVLNVLTVDDLFQLKVTNQLHHLSIKRGIQILRHQNFEPSCLKRRAIPGEVVDAHNVSLWTNHRVMEWLKQVDLSEYAPNLRGSGVHGALMVFEDRFNDELIASILAIPASKTLLRRHLSIHFKQLVGRDVMQSKRVVETEVNFVALTPTAKAKVRVGGGQFTLKRKKSKAQFDQEDLLCPFK